MSFAIMDGRKENPNTLYALCSTLDGARQWIEKVNVNHFIDKTLTRDVFTIVERKSGEVVK